MNFHEFSVLLESKQWLGEPPDKCSICGAEFEPRGGMPEFTFYDAAIPPPPKSEDAMVAVAHSIVTQRKRDGDSRQAEDILEFLIEGDGRFPGWLRWPRGIWGYLCESCHEALTRSGMRLQGQQYSVGGNRTKLGDSR
jgi:hypothetical protein